MTKDFDNRMHHLKKSYEQLPTQSNVKQIVHNLPNIEVESTKLRRKMRKPPLPAIVFIAFIFLGAVCTTWILQNQSTLPSNTQTTLVGTDELESDTSFEEIMEQFEKSVPQYAKELGLTVEQYKRLQYVQNVYSILEYMIQENLTGEDTNMEEWEIRIAKDIQPPHAMVQDLEKGQQLTLEEEMSFLYSYGEKITQLSGLYNELLASNELQGDSYELKQQGFQLVENKKGNAYQYSYESFESILTNKLSPSALGYIESLTMQPYFYAGDFLYSPMEIAQSLVKLEPLLTSEDYDPFQDYELLQLYYQNGMFKLFTGTDSYVVFENGSYSPSFLSIMNQLIEQDSALSEMATTILSEISDTGQSATLDGITYNAIWKEVMSTKYEGLENEMEIK